MKKIQFPSLMKLFDSEEIEDVKIEMIQTQIQAMVETDSEQTRERAEMINQIQRREVEIKVLR